MAAGRLCVVTGALGYTGRYIAAELLARGASVRTMTRHRDRPNPFGDRIEMVPLDFSDVEGLTQSLSGADVLINTYWVRFNYGDTTFARAERNTKVLFRSAVRAGVRKIVHVSIANPSCDSPLPYYRGKAALESYLSTIDVPHTIIRPTVIFGVEDILINNIAWLLRKCPFFVIPGDGEYRVQPVSVEDVGTLAAQAAADDQSGVIDAVGPEIYTFNELVAAIAEAVGATPRLIHAPPVVAWLASCGFGAFLRDIVVTRDELRGLMGNLLVSRHAPTGQRSFRAFLGDQRDRLGRRYASELARHYR